MSGGQRFSGRTIREYDEFPERARKQLFSKDREIRKATARYAKAESTLEFIHWVIRDEGTRDPSWVLERILESLLGHGYWPKCEEHLAPEPCAECRGIPLPGPLDLVNRHPDIPVAVPARDGHGLLEALGIQPGGEADNERRRELESALQRIREAEHAARLAAAQIWLDGPKCAGTVGKDGKR